MFSECQTAFKEGVAAPGAAPYGAGSAENNLLSTSVKLKKTRYLEDHTLLAKATTACSVDGMTCGVVATSVTQRISKRLKRK